jgi:hypothetical protein
MPRESHGKTISLETLQADLAADGAADDFPFSPEHVAEPDPLNKFGYLFPDLQKVRHLLPVGAETCANLKLLGATMHDTAPEDGRNSRIPAAYTYLGQFIDHDITHEDHDVFEDTPHKELAVRLFDLEDLSVLPHDQLLHLMKNKRTALLDLDSLYGGEAQYNGEYMRLGRVSPTGNAVPNKDIWNDLPRSGRSDEWELDRYALIGDPRNDENLNISQLHLAFLKAHNAIVDAGHDKENARHILHQLYQWIVVNDFLVKIAGQEIVDAVKKGNKFFTPDADEVYIPLEFSVAAYRFGHSMVRAAYEYNVYINSRSDPANNTLNQLFSYTALSGQIGHGDGYDTLPDDHVIQWENFVNPLVNPARRIDTRLVDPLFMLQNLIGEVEEGIKASLAIRNLLRGYKMRMPTGQAVATRMSLPVLAASDLRDLIAANADRSDLSAEDKTTLKNAGFDERSPLWFYILAEAELTQNGMRLGHVGATIVAEVLIGLVRHSPDSIFKMGAGWNPSRLAHEMQRPMNPNYHLMALLRLAGVHS